MHHSFLHRILPVLLAVVICAQSARGQLVADQILVKALDPATPAWNPLLLRFDRKLQLLGKTDLKPLGMSDWAPDQTVALTNRGQIWTSVPCGGACKRVVRLASTGATQLTVNLSHFPDVLAVDRTGAAFVLTFGSPSGLGPVIKLGTNGQVVWTNAASTAGLANQLPAGLAVAPDQTLWVGGQHYVGTFTSAWARRLSGADGSVLSTFEDWFGVAVSGSMFFRIQSTPQGLAWMLLGGWLPPGGSTGKFVLTDGAAQLGAVFTPGFGDPDGARVDALGRPWMVVIVNDYSHLVCFDPATGGQGASWFLGWGVDEFAFGPTGEEVFYVRKLVSPAFGRQLVKFSLVTGQSSWIPLDPTYTFGDVIDGDPTGFVLANTVDQQGDNDLDGFTNRDEVAQGYNPYDPMSRPGGPKVYLSYGPAPAHALRLRYVDPDGILDPAGGLDTATLSVLAEHPLYGSGEIFWDLAAYLTSVTFSPDGSQVDLDFGALVLPKGLGFGLTASVSDKTGARAWDWHMTPH